MKKFISERGCYYIKIVVIAILVVIPFIIPIYLNAQLDAQLAEISRASSSNSRSNGSLTATCKSCGRTFSFEYDKENYRSVKNSNMCKTCKKNYKDAQQALH